MVRYKPLSPLYKPSSITYLTLLQIFLSLRYLLIVTVVTSRDLRALIQVHIC